MSWPSDFARRCQKRGTKSKCVWGRGRWQGHSEQQQLAVFFFLFFSVRCQCLRGAPRRRAREHSSEDRSLNSHPRVASATPDSPTTSSSRCARVGVLLALSPSSFPPHPTRWRCHTAVMSPDPVWWVDRGPRVSPHLTLTGTPRLLSPPLLAPIFAPCHEVVPCWPRALRPRPKKESQLLIWRRDSLGISFGRDSITCMQNIT